MIRGLLSIYSWRYPRALVYMLQSTEYQAVAYLRWYWHTIDFSGVAHRRSLELTEVARLLLLALYVGMGLELIAGMVLVGLWFTHGIVGFWQFGLALIIGYPVILGHLVVVPLIAGKLLIVLPRERRLVRTSEKIFREHPGVKIAVAGSYGKTTMKELLHTVLSEGKKVAATPANKNVSISHAYFAQKLTGDEDIIIIEYGEGAPGDIARFVAITHPTHAIITGIAPAHLDRYKTLARAAADIFSVGSAVPKGQTYVNAESPNAEPYLTKELSRYTEGGALGWKVSDVRINLDGTRFRLKKGGRALKLHSGLLGRHQIGPLSLAAALALEFGMTNEQVAAGIAKTQPFEHRMQPYQLHGAWIIDDTYNGNIEGVRAGTRLLTELPGRRKIYVTPGLVDQGHETEAVHNELGQLIASAKPDVVVLMQNSVTEFIRTGLEQAGYAGEIIIVSDPLDFYTNLQAFVASGDLVLMQNDWTDNYT